MEDYDDFLDDFGDSLGFEGTPLDDLTPEDNSDKFDNFII
jgi:hypothetical protein